MSRALGAWVFDAAAAPKGARATNVRTWLLGDKDGVFGCAADADSDMGDELAHGEDERGCGSEREKDVILGWVTDNVMLIGLEFPWDR